MEADTDSRIPILKVDGGASRNDLLMQHQADLLGIPVVRGQVTETTAMGAAFLAGLAVGNWRSLKDLSDHWKEDRRFEPNWNASQRSTAMAGWRRAVRAATLPDTENR
jgi:glycerol kinase